MTYSELKENDGIRKTVMDDIVWINDLSEINIEKGIYFLKDIKSDEVVYIGKGGGVGQNLKTRVGQYFKPSDTGTIAFKHKVMSYPEGYDKSEKILHYKKYYQEGWKEFMKKGFKIGILSIEEKSEHDIKIEEAYLIGLFRPKYNY